MVIIFLLILIYLIYNYRTFDFFTSAVFSPHIKKIDREKKYLDITFEKDVNDNIQPGDKYVYEIYYKSQDEVLEDEVLNGNINIQMDTWTIKEVECDSIKCNEIIYISDSNTYYFFILVRLGDKNSDKRSEIREIIKSEGKFDGKIYSPDILQIRKEGSNCNLLFMRSKRDYSVPKDKMRYEIYYAKEEDVDLTPSPSNSPGASSSPGDSSSPGASPGPSGGESDNWMKKVVICDEVKCSTRIGNLDGDSYYFFIIQVKNGRKSSIDNIVKVTDEEPYAPLEYSLEDYTSGFSFDEDTPCKDYSYDNCPDKLSGTILSRCYKDRELEKCITSGVDKYL